MNVDSLLERKLNKVIEILENDNELLLEKNDSFLKGLLYGYYWAFIELFFARTPDDEERGHIREFYEENEERLKRFV